MVQANEISYVIFLYCPNIDQEKWSDSEIEQNFLNLNWKVRNCRLKAEWLNPNESKVVTLTKLNQGTLYRAQYFSRTPNITLRSSGTLVFQTDFVEKNFLRLTMFTSSSMDWRKKQSLLCTFISKLNFDEANLFTSEGINCNSALMDQVLIKYLDSNQVKNFNDNEATDFDQRYS